MLIENINESSNAAYFGNAREVRNFFEKVIAKQANRMALLSSPSKQDLESIIPEDLPVDFIKIEEAEIKADEEIEKNINTTDFTQSTIRERNRRLAKNLCEFIKNQYGV